MVDCGREFLCLSTLPPLLISHRQAPGDFGQGNQKGWSELNHKHHYNEDPAIRLGFAQFCPHCCCLRFKHKLSPRANRNHSASLSSL